MTDAIITAVLILVAKILNEKFWEEVRLVCGAEEEFKKLESELRSMKAVLVDAEKRQVKEECVKVWLKKLKDISNETQAILSEWINAMWKIGGQGRSPSSPIRKVCSFFFLPCFGWKRVILFRDIALKIKKVNQRLGDLAVERERFKFKEFTGTTRGDTPKTTSHILESQVVGRVVEKGKVISQLLSGNNQNRNREGLVPNIVSIVGVQGIGKTTLAQLVYNSSDVIRHFDTRIWVCAPDPFNQVRVGKAILEDIEDRAPYLFELQTITRRISNCVEGHRFLLVLDGVYTEDFREWEQLFNCLATGAPASAILVTTTKESVAEYMGSSYQLHLGELDADDSWSLFKKMAFLGRDEEECENLGDVARKIAQECKGSPLTIKKIATMMRSKKSCTDDWMDVFNTHQF